MTQVDIQFNSLSDIMLLYGYSSKHVLLFVFLLLIYKDYML